MSTFGRAAVRVTGAMLVAWSAAVLAAGSVRVRCENGVPRILVDGKAVRARMFWGAPGRAPLPVEPGGGDIAFEFTATESEPDRATMHIRFGRAPGTIDLDNIHVTDLETGADIIPACTFEGGQEDFSRAWTFWPTGDANTVATMTVEKGVGEAGSGGLRVVLAEPPGGAWPDFHIYHIPNLSLVGGRRYRVSVWARASSERDLTIAFYRPGSTFVHLGGPPGPFESQVRLAADAGVDFVSMPVPLPWPETVDDVDWTGVDARCRAVLAVNPKALLLPRIGMEPPSWWKKRYPGEAMVWEDGPRNRGVSVASPRYRRDAAERLRVLVRHLEETFGEHMAGYHPCGQNTGEWFYQDTWKPELAGYSDATREAWRAWLRQRYGSDAALQRAWADPQVTLAGADVPSPAVRHAAPEGVLREPRGNRMLVDFVTFEQDAMAECVCALAEAVREGTAGRRLVVFFFGYVFEFAAVYKGPAESGHYGIRRVLQSPDIDILCSPISYWDRGLGGTAHAMTAAESVALAGKMWLYEDDTATYLSSGVFPGWRQKVSTLEETNAKLMRNVVQEACRNLGTWWMDLGASGWFNDAGMWDVMEQLAPVDRAFLAAPAAFRPEIAAVLDPGSMLLVNEGGITVTRPLIYEGRTSFGRAGAPYGQYLLDDVIAGNVPARVKVFLNAWQLSAAERAALRSVTAGDTSVWCYAPGYVDEDTFSLEAMEDLTGFSYAALGGVEAWAEPTSAGMASGLTGGFGVRKVVRPLFAVRDAAEGEVLARYSDGSAAVVLRRRGAGRSLFVGVPSVPAQLLRLASREAGAHLYTQTDCNVYANGATVAVHASRDGTVSLDVGTPGPVEDVITGETAGQGPVIELDLELGDTRVFRRSR